MVGEMAQNSQSLYAFTFNAFILIHEYIYSHSATKSSVKKYNNWHLTKYFLSRNVFTHLRDVFIHIHDRNIHSTISAHRLRTSVGPSSRSIIPEQHGGRRKAYYMKGQNKDQRPQIQIWHELQEIKDCSMISDEPVDNPVKRFDDGKLFGYFLVTGHLRSLGLRSLSGRIGKCISRVDPRTSRIS